MLTGGLRLSRAATFDGEIRGAGSVLHRLCFQGDGDLTGKACDGSSVARLPVALELYKAVSGSSPMEERPIKETANEARQSVKVWPMKYVLGYGLAGAAVGMLLAWVLM
jgi:hypothetical protein